MMSSFEHFGNPAVGAAIGLGLLGLGYFYKDNRSWLAGLAVLIAVFAAFGVAEAFKHALPSSDPRLPSVFGLPSSQTGAAFALASALSVTWPGLGPIFFGFAILAGIAHLYARANYLWHVIGGAALGLAIGLSIAIKLIPRTKVFGRYSLGFIGWSSACAFGLAALMFFFSTESQLAAHLSASDSPLSSGVTAQFDFGTAQARSSLRYGWSGDESWSNGKRSVVWADGLASELIMHLPAEQDYSFRFNAFPYRSKGPACQRVEVRVNGLIVAKVLLVRGWHWYQFDVPRTTVHAGRNFVQFFYSYAETPRSRGHNADERKLSVAFDMLEATPKS
jgi:hypothetical protein